MTTPTQGEHAQTEALRPKFGDLLRNTMASESNPRRDAYFIREVHRSGGGVNPGRWFEMTDGNGETWLSNPQNLVQAAPAQPAELAHELFAAAQLAPGEGIEDAVSRIVAALTAATAQPAAPQGVAYAGPSEFPAGAIVNGRTHIDRLESFYRFDCEAGPLINCDDWHGLKRCFEHLALRASNGQAPATKQAGEVEFDGYKGHENVRWYINNLQRIRIVNQWFADGYCNKLREFFTSEHRRNGQKERDAERMAENDLRALASKVRNLADECWSPGENMPEQFVGIHDTVTERLLSVLTPQPTPTAQAAPAACEWDARGQLAASLTCWHRLTGKEADELVSLFQGMRELAADKTLAYESVLAELVDKITGADSGDILADALAASKALDERAAPATGAVAGPGWKLVPVVVTNEMWEAYKRPSGKSGDWSFAERYTAMLAASPTPAAQADSVLEDAARWQELREQHESDADRCCVFAPNDMRECLVPVGSLPGELDAFMDSERQKSAARKQGGA